jgi:hypothetical protein
MVETTRQAGALESKVRVTRKMRVAGARMLNTYCSDEHRHYGDDEIVERIFMAMSQQSRRLAGRILQTKLGEC